MLLNEIAEVSSHISFFIILINYELFKNNIFLDISKYIILKLFLLNIKVNVFYYKKYFLNFLLIKGFTFLIYIGIFSYNFEN